MRVCVSGGFNSHRCQQLLTGPQNYGKSGPLLCRVVSTVQRRFRLLPQAAELALFLKSATGVRIKYHSSLCKIWFIPIDVNSGPYKIKLEPHAVLAT